MAITALSIAKKFVVNPSTPAGTLVLTDDTDYPTYGLVAADVEINFTIVAPIGIIHDNQSFSSPDITPGNGSYSESLPLATDDLPVRGYYSHTAEVRVTKAITAVVDGANGTFTIGGDRVDDILSAGTFTVTGSTGNDATYTVVDATLVGGDTVIEVATIPDATVDGDIYYDLTMAEDEYEFQFCKPVLELDMEYNCDRSVIQSSDVSDYTITVDGSFSSLAPDTVSLINTLRYPQGIVPAKADIVTGSSQITVSPIWTKTWTGILTPTVTYTLPAAMGSLEVEYTTTITDEIDVACDRGLCSMRSCLQNLYNSYVAALSDNPKDAERWARRLTKAVGAYMVYSVALTCGDSDMKQTAMNELKAIASASGCDCCSDSTGDTGPQEVIPISGVISGNGSTTVVGTAGNGITVAAVTSGTVTTYTLTVSYSIVAANLKASQSEVNAGTVDDKFVTPLKLSTWFTAKIAALGNNQVLTTNGSGALSSQAQATAFNKPFGDDPGEVPAIGSTLAPNSSVFTNASGELETGAAATDKYGLLDYNYTDVANAANPTEQTLNTYTLPANTLAADGDYIRVTQEAEVTTTPGFSLSTNTVLKIKFGSYSAAYIANLFGDFTGAIFRMTMEVHRITSATQRISIGLQINDYPATLFGTFVVAGTEDLTANVDIEFTGQALGSVANQVTQKIWKVEIFKG